MQASRGTVNRVRLSVCSVAVLAILTPLTSSVAEPMAIALFAPLPFNQSPAYQLIACSVAEQNICNSRHDRCLKQGNGGPNSCDQTLARCLKSCPSGRQVLQ
jgi:hypothetical protein